MDTLLSERLDLDGADDVTPWAAAFAATKRVTGPEDRAPIDRAHLSRYTLGDATLEHEILDLFVAQLPSYLADLAAAPDEAAFAMAAHTIKGSARAVGAARLAGAARAAELSRGDDPATRLALVTAVDAAFAEAARFIRTIIDAERS